MTDELGPIHERTEQNKWVYYHKGSPMYDDGTHIEAEGWYFVTETQADYIGPYTSYEEACKKMHEYAQSL